MPGTGYRLVSFVASDVLGNPSNDNTEDLLLKNLGARDGQSIPLNNIRLKPLNMASRKIHRENTYDSTERYGRDKVDGGKLMYHNPGCVLDGDKPAYQSLMKEDASTRFNSESNLGMSQSLDQDGLMYQPLQKNSAHKVLHSLLCLPPSHPPSLPSFLPSFLPAFLPSFLPSSLPPSYPPSYLPSFLPLQMFLYK